LAGQIEEIFDAQITTTAQLTKLVSLIFEKTVKEHIYGPLYAKLCVTLSLKDKVFNEVLSGPHSQGKDTRQVDFKYVLVKVCQTEFEKGKRPPTFTDDMDSRDREIETIKAKTILLGNMKFIGQLYLSHLIPPQVMTLCLKHLIAPSGRRPSDDDVEGACTLLNTVGPALDGDDEIDGEELDKMYQKLRNISKSGRHNVRIKILVRNLHDLRKRSWNDSRAIKVDGPKQLRTKPRINGPTTVNELFDVMESITTSTVPISAQYRCTQSEQRTNRTRSTRSRVRKKRVLLQTEDE